MQIKYQIITNITLYHQFFENQRLETLITSPSNDTKLNLLNYNLILKQFKDGFAIILGAKEDELERVKANLLNLRN